MFKFVKKTYHWIVLQIKIRLTDHPEDVENPEAESDEEVRSLDFVSLEGDENQDLVISDENSSDSTLFSNENNENNQFEESEEEIRQKTKTNVRDSKVTSSNEVKT